ncbi:hypothetical protein GQ600_1133 [Phytophthora cactorum]|nr:hypothetical protein GQ600_1133 [Phytophthora cactorum]
MAALGQPRAEWKCAVVIQISPGHEGHNIRWISSISFTSATTTNNVAENLGLLIGLRAYHRHNWIPLQAIGDSCIIIQHQRARRRPRLSISSGVLAEQVARRPSQCLQMPPPSERIHQNGGYTG